MHLVIELTDPISVGVYRLLFIWWCWVTTLLIYKVGKYCLNTLRKICFLISIAVNTQNMHFYTPWYEGNFYRKYFLQPVPEATTLYKTQLHHFCLYISPSSSSKFFVFVDGLISNVSITLEFMPGLFSARSVLFIVAVNNKLFDLDLLFDQGIRCPPLNFGEVKVHSQPKLSFHAFRLHTIHRLYLMESFN